MRAVDRFEYATNADPALNYCLWDYKPPAPAEDKFRSINVLYNAFDAAGIGEAAFAVVEAIRDGIGPFRTVFGTKLIKGTLSWEFYFYDYQRRGRMVSISRVLEIIRPWMPCAVVPNEALPYFMFSLDLNPATLSRAGLDIVHMYVGHPSNSLSSGIAYALRAGSTTLENFYFFFDAATQLDQVAAKVESSAVFDASRVPLAQVLVPEFVGCKTICVANKQTHDCIYFSGVTVAQLLLFLERLAFPEAIAAWIRSNMVQLDHLLFDVGFDYQMQDGRFVILKSGYYGVF